MCTTPPQEKGQEKEVRVRGDHQEASPDEESFEDMMRELTDALVEIWDRMEMRLAA